MDGLAPPLTTGAWDHELRGELSLSTDVTQLLGHIISRSLDARLTLGDPSTSGVSLSFVGGELLRVHSAQAVHGLLDELHKEGKLSLAQHGDAIARGFADAEGAVAHLVDAGLLRAQSSRALLVAHQTQLFGLALRHRSGAFGLAPIDKPDDLSTPWVPKERLLLDGIREHYDVERLAVLLAPADAALYRTQPAPECWGLRDAEHRWTLLLEGHLSIAAAAEHAELPLRSAQQLALALVRLGCAHFVGDLRRAHFGPAPIARADMHDSVDGDEHAALDGQKAGSELESPANFDFLAHKVGQARERDYFVVLGLCPSAVPSEVAAASAALREAVARASSKHQAAEPMRELDGIVADARDVLLDSRRAAPYTQQLF